MRVRNLVATASRCDVDQPDRTLGQAQDVGILPGRRGDELQQVCPEGPLAVGGRDHSQAV
jgi:hypothetical protein